MNKIYLAEGNGLRVKVGVIDSKFLNFNNNIKNQYQLIFESITPEVERLKSTKIMHCLCPKPSAK